jgi:hypothetical protein
MVTIKSGLSPAVRVKEIDLSDYVSNEINTIALLIGNTSMGPAFKIDVVPDERTFQETYGDPSDDNAQTWFAASGYFARGSNLIFTRVVDRPTAKVAAIGFGRTAADSFPTVANLDPLIYVNDTVNYPEVVSGATIVDQAEIESFYDDVYAGCEAFYTRHTTNRAYPRVRNAVYKVGDLIHDGWYEIAAATIEHFNGQTSTNIGTWIFNAGTPPTLSPNDGDYYVVSGSGTTTFGNGGDGLELENGDLLVYDLDYRNDTDTAWGNWRKLIATFRPNGYVYRCITEGLTGYAFNTSGELAQAIADGVVLNGDVLAWDTEMDATTADGEVVWQRVLWVDQTSIGGIRFKHGSTVEPEYFDPEDTSTFDYSVEINGAAKSEDLVITAVGPGEAYDSYYIALLGWRDSENLKKYAYSLSIPRAYMQSNSPVPSEFADWGDAETGSLYRHFLSRVTYKQFADRFDYVNDLPGNLPKSSEEFGILVLGRDVVSGSWNTVEYWRASTDKNSFDENGSPLFVEDVINNRSKIIRAKLSDTALGAEFTTTLPIALEGGYVGQLSNFYEVVESPDRNNGEPTSLVGELITACDMYREQDIDIDVIIEGDKPVSAKKELAQLAEDLNGEAIAILDVPFDYSTPMQMIEWVSEELLLSTSYAALYHNRSKIYDKYNGVYRWVANSGTVGGVYAWVDKNYYPWYAPAGMRRATLNEVEDIREKFRIPSRDILYANRINPIAIIRNAITIYGQKTLLDRDSYLNRVNVRRLLCFLKRKCRRLAEEFIFEFNDEFTRAELRGVFNEFLQWVQNNRGLQEFLVVCNEMNNPPIVRDNNELYVDIYVKPTPVAEFIWLRFYITRSGVNLQELATRVVPGTNPA